MPMQLDEFPEKDRGMAEKIKAFAEKKEGVWAYFSQKVYLGTTTFGAHGVCAALSVKFIGQIAKNLQFEEIQSPEGRESVMALAIQQKESAGWATLYLEYFSLALACTRLGDTIESICDLVKIEGYYVITMSDATGSHSSVAELEKKVSVHAIAVCNTADRCWFFDPNYGVGLFTSMDKLSEFMKTYWAKVYPEWTTGATILERYILKR